MKSTYDIARRLFAGQGKSDASRPAVRVAVVSIMLGVMVMMLTFSIVYGFKATVREKAIGFGGHIQLVNFDNNSTYEMQPIAYSDSLLNHLRTLPGVVDVAPFATKPGIIKTDEAFQGVVLKGLAETDEFFARHLISGRMPEEMNEVLLSKMLAKMLHLEQDDRFYCYFIGDDVRVRRFTIVGIYDTQLADYDKLFLIGDIAQVRQLNDWDDHQASGIEVRIADFDDLEQVSDEVFFATCNRLDEDGNAFYMQTVEEKNPAIFSWLSLLDMNVVVIVLLMLAVSAMGIISGLIILILDSIRMIGTMKAMGATNRYLRKIFLWQAAMLICKGMLWGNVIGLIICALQYFFHLVPLDPATYYVAYVPIQWCWGKWILLDLGTLFVTLILLLLPSAIIAHISPAKVMRYE